MSAQDVARYGHGSRIPGWDDAVDLSKDPASIPDPALTPVPAELRQQIEDAMARYPDFRSAAIPALHAAQELHGWCSPEAIEQVACVMRLTPAYLTAVVGFYDMFESRPVGRNTVYVCTNISCSLRGARRLHEAMQAAAGDDPDFNVRAFECLGACDIAPMASVNGAYVGPLELSDAETIVAQLRAGEEILPDKQLLRRKVADPRAVGGGDATSAPVESAGGAETASAEAAQDESSARREAPTLFDDEDRS
ncbi:MAG: NADH-quinone oxidoreductase subunit NuoE family protein [Conexibacter sp.]